MYKNMDNPMVHMVQIPKASVTLKREAYEMKNCFDTLCYSCSACAFSSRKTDAFPNRQTNVTTANNVSIIRSECFKNSRLCIIK